MLVINKGLDAFFHSLIPAELQTKFPRRTMSYIRVRSLATLLVLVTAISALANLLVGGSHLLWQTDMLKYDLVSLGILVLLGLQTWLFYRYKNDWISGIAFTNFYFLIAVVLVLLSGGYESHGKAFLLSCPVISFLVGGRQEGLQNSVALIAVCLAMAILYVLNFQMPNFFAAQPDFLLFAVNWLATVTIITIVLLVYETELEQRSVSRQPVAREDFIGRSDTHIQDWIARMVPSALRANMDPASPAYVRTQTVTVMLILGSVISTLVTFLYTVYHYLTNPEFLAHDLVAGLIAVCFILQLILLYRRQNHSLSRLIMSIFYSVMIFSLVFISGGYRSPFMMLLITSPVVSFMLNGLRGGAINSSAIAAIGIGFAWLEFSGQGLENRIANLSDVLCFSIVWPLIVAGIAVCMMLYDMALEKPGTN